MKPLPKPPPTPLPWAALGWDLPHTHIVRRPLSRSHFETVPPSEHPGEAHSWGTAGVVFLGSREWETVWARAVGSGTGLFRSAAVEDEAWRELAEVAGRLGALLRSGGWLVCRLERPRRVCRVLRRPKVPAGARCALPRPPELPERLDALCCLRLLDTRFASLVFGRPRDPVQPVALGCRRDHPLYAYLKTLAAEIAPSATLAELPEGAEVLAATAGGEPIAAVCDRLVLLPTLRRSQPRREAELLFEALCRLSAARRDSAVPASAPRQPDVPAEVRRRWSLPGVDRLRDREAGLKGSLEQISRKLQATAGERRRREQLWRLLDSETPAEFCRAVRLALAVLGLKPIGGVRRCAQGARCRLGGAQIVLTANVQPPTGERPGALDTGILLDGNVQRISAPRSVVFLRPGGEAHKTRTHPPRRNDKGTPAVRAEELFRAVCAVLERPGDENWRKQLGHELLATGTTRVVAPAAEPRPGTPVSHGGKSSHRLLTAVNEVLESDSLVTQAAALERLVQLFREREAGPATHTGPRAKR